MIEETGAFTILGIPQKREFKTIKGVLRLFSIHRENQLTANTFFHISSNNQNSLRASRLVTLLCISIGFGDEWKLRSFW
jgi:hypothetical protein